MFSFFEPNFIEKFFWEVVFQILAKIEMMRNKNRLFGRRFETVKHFQIFSAEFWIFIAHTYMVQISLQNSGGKKVFYAWVPRNPPSWAPTGVKVPWSLIKVLNRQRFTILLAKVSMF